ncbi:MAG: hypothetical protein P8N99_09065, partial [Luminiphilus sp.]|nr:hypothetical protein [Luminiphilus sp.]
MAHAVGYSAEATHSYFCHVFSSGCWWSVGAEAKKTPNSFHRVERPEVPIDYSTSITTLLMVPVKRVSAGPT